MKITSTHANFSVNDLAKAKDFYTGLGFKVLHEHEGGLFLESPAGTHVEIYQKDDHKAWDSTVFGVEVDDVEGAVAELKEKGIKAEGVEGTDANGIAAKGEWKAAWIKDPAGNWVCFSNIGSLK